MRIKRNDLAKQFEEIVNQEIINHNKNIEATNIQLQTFQKTIDILQQQYASYIAASTAKITKLEKEIYNIENSFKLINNREIVHYDQLQDEIISVKDDFSKEFEDIDLNYIQEDTFNQICDSLKICMNSYEQQLDKLRFYLHSEIYSLNNQCKKWLIEFKEELSNMPSEIIPLKKELEDKIEIAKVDATGVLRELRTMKKDFFIMGKQIEDIYNKLKKFGVNTL